MPKILVVDDREHVRLLYSEELSEAGYEVVTADSKMTSDRLPPTFLLKKKYAPLIGPIAGTAPSCDTNLRAQTGKSAPRAGQLWNHHERKLV